MLEWPHKELHEARWPTITHRRVAQYVSLYQSFLFQTTYFLVAHKNNVSLYDIVQKKFTDNFKFDDQVQCLAKCNPVTDSGSKSQTAVLVGSSRIWFIEQRSKKELKTKEAPQVNESLQHFNEDQAFDRQSTVKKASENDDLPLFKSENSIDIDGRAISWMVDKDNVSGLYILTDSQASEGKIYNEDFETSNRFYSYENERLNQESKGTENCFISVYSKGKITKLLHQQSFSANHTAISLKFTTQLVVYSGVTNELRDAVGTTKDHEYVKKDDLEIKLMIVNFKFDEKK